MRVEGTNISMIRGDTEYIEVVCRDSEGNMIPFVEGDTLYFTVKTNIHNEKKALQKVITEFDDGIAYIEIKPEDTKHLEFFDYVYDIQLTSAEGVVTTIIPPSKFTIEGEVTYE